MTERRQMGMKYEITDKVMSPERSIRSQFTIDFLRKKTKQNSLENFQGNTQHYDLQFKQ